MRDGGSAATCPQTGDLIMADEDGVVVLPLADAESAIAAAEGHNAKEVAAQGIRVNAVAPGTVRTRIHADAGDPGRAERAASRIPLGRPGEPDEIAPAIAWLLSSQASYVTGASIRVAGGL